MADQFNLSQCVIGKNGCTSTAKIFEALIAFSNGSQVEDKQKWKIVPNVRPKFVVARHPMARLVSCYKERITRIGPGRTIIPGLNDLWRSRTKSLTFGRFFSFVTRHPFMDIHWSPQSALCDPCSVNFDYVLKVETFGDDLEAMVQNVTDFRPSIPHERKTAQNRTADVDAMKRLLKKAPSKALVKYLNIFRHDFELFGYDFEAFKRIVDEIIDARKDKIN